jgi:hypothetical protein
MYLSEHNLSPVRDLDGVFLVQLKDHGDNYQHSMYDISTVFDAKTNISDLPQDLTLLATAQMSVYWTDVGKYRVCLQLLECFSTGESRNCDNLILRVDTPYMDVICSGEIMTLDAVSVDSLANHELHIQATTTLDEYLSKIRDDEVAGIQHMCVDTPFSGKGVIADGLSKLYGGKTIMVAYNPSFKDSGMDLTMLKSYINDNNRIDVYGSDGTVHDHLILYAAMLLDAEPGPLGGDVRIMDLCFQTPPNLPKGNMLQIGVITKPGSSDLALVGKYVPVPSDDPCDSDLAAAVSVFEKLSAKGVC